MNELAQIHAFSDIPEAEIIEMPMSEPAEYIWIRNWERFQMYTKKRGQPWVPPWIKLYPSLLDDPMWITLTPETRSLLVGLFMLFPRSRGTLTRDTRNLSRQLAQRVTKRQLESLNQARFIEFCSGTVREQRWSAFLNMEGTNENEDVNEDSLTRQSRDDGHGQAMLECNRCGKPVRPRGSCRHCGATPRTAGTNQRSLDKLGKADPCEHCEVGGGHHLADCPKGGAA